MAASSFALFLSLAMVGAGGSVVEVEVGENSPGGIVVGPGGRPVSGAVLIATIGGLDGWPLTTIGRTRTDSEGRFAIGLDRRPTSQDRLRFWATAEGLVVGSRPIGRRALEGEPVRIVLDPEVGADFVVNGPDGQPIAGARVIPRRVAHDPSEIPREIAEAVSATTNLEGRAVLKRFRPEELIEVAVVAAGFGLQVREFARPGGLAELGTKGVTLHPVGRVVGRVVADDPKVTAGLTVIAESTGGRGASVVGFAEVSTDPSGHFEIPAIATGSLTVRVRPVDGSPDLPARVIRRELEPGQTLDVEIPLRRGVRVNGLAADALDGRPIAGVTVSILPTGAVGPISVVTDPQGRYEAFVPAGLVTHRILGVAPPYLQPPSFVGPRPVEVPQAIARFDLPTIKLQRGGELRGSVVDARGKPVDGAKVDASWMMIEGRARAPRSEATATQADGTFVLEPVPTDSELSLVGSTDDGSTSRPILVHPGDPKPVELRIVEPDGLVASGLVRSAEGGALAGVSVRIWESERPLGGSTASPRLLRFGSSDHLTTDDQGRFQPPTPLRADRDYRAFAQLEGFRPGQSRTFEAPDSGSIAFKDLVLDPERRQVAIEGRVVDRDGHPLAGVKVRTSLDGPSRRPTLSDDAGRFQIQGIHEGPFFLFAEKDGFRFFGRAIASVGPTIEIPLDRQDERVSVAMKTRTIPSNGVALALARRVLTPYAEKVLTEGDHATRIKALELLARVDPVRVLKLIEDRIIADDWLADHLRHAAASSPSAGTDEERRAIVGAIRDAEWRVVAGLDAALALPETARAVQGEWIERALADTRKITEPTRRLVCLARVAGRLLDLGQLDRATRILEEARPIAERLPPSTASGRALVEFAQCLARVDPNAGLALTEGLIDPGVSDRCRVEIARNLASTDPARSTRILERLRDPRSLEPSIPALCRAFARVDPAQGRKLLERVRGDEPCLAPYALGLMARAVADHDKSKATAWLREAFDRLGRIAAAPPGSGCSRDPAAVAAALLPVAERVDPTLVPELFWRAVSFPSLRPGSEIPDDAVLALLLARYDRSVALTFLAPLTDRALHSTQADYAPLIAALTILDPVRAIDLVERLPEPADLTFHHPKHEARLALTASLIRGAPHCWDDATRRFLGLSDGPTPGDE